MPVDTATEWAYDLTLLTPPVSEPVTVAEVKAHCGITWDGVDTTLDRIARAARRRCESYQERQYMPATWVLSARDFPWSTRMNPEAAIKLPKPPLLSVTSIQYRDANGTLQTMSASDYVVTTPTKQQGKVYPAYGISWPSVQPHPAAVVVTYVAGYASAALVPEETKLAIYGMVDFLNENRGDDVTELPNHIRWLLDSEAWGTAF